MQLDSQNEWVKDANRLPWKVWEASYASMFPGIKGCVAKPCRMVIGSFIIQQRMGFSDRDLVKQIQENPYYQYFIGLESFQHTPPFVPTLLVEWRKRIDVSFVIKANDALCDAMPKERRNKKSFGLSSRGTLVATQVCDATVAPQNIRFPQDTSLLNEARTKLEKMIDWFCSKYGLEKPRTYRKVAHKEYLAFAKSKKPSIDRIRLTIRQQLGYVNRDLKYVDGFIQEGYELDRKFLDDLETIRKVYEQQTYMLENNTHKVADRQYQSAIRPSSRTR